MSKAEASDASSTSDIIPSNNFWITQGTLAPHHHVPWVPVILSMVPFFCTNLAANDEPAVPLNNQRTVDSRSVHDVLGLYGLFG